LAAHTEEEQEQEEEQDNNSDEDYKVSQRRRKDYRVHHSSTNKSIKGRSPKKNGTTTSRKERSSVENGHHGSKSAAAAAATGGASYVTRCATGSIKRKHYDIDEALDSAGADHDDNKDKDFVVDRRRLDSVKRRRLVHGDDVVDTRRRRLNLGRMSSRRLDESGDHRPRSVGSEFEQSCSSDGGEEDVGKADGNETEVYSEHSSPTTTLRRRSKPLTRRKSGGDSRSKSRRDFSESGGKHARKDDRSRYGTRNQGRRTVLYQEESDDAVRDYDDTQPHGGVVEKELSDTEVGSGTDDEDYHETHGVDLNVSSRGRVRRPKLRQ